MMKTAKERFDAKWTGEPNTGCWLWTARLTHKGYGQLYIGSRDEKNPSAHRASWEFTNGPVPDGLLVLHKCDVRCCVNPDHLFLGTAADNTADMFAKGRNRVRWKLSSEKVGLIRSAVGTQQSIADRFGVSQTHVSDIRAGRVRPG